MEGQTLCRLLQIQRQWHSGAEAACLRLEGKVVPAEALRSLKQVACARSSARRR